MSQAELEQFGVRGVDAGAIEAELMAKAQKAGAMLAPEPTGDDPAALQQQLYAVKRELRALAAAVEAFQQQHQEEEQQEQEDEQEQGVSEADTAAPLLAAASAGGTLQQAVMQQRLVDLQARKEQLEEQLAGLGIGANTAAGDAAGPRVPTQAAAHGKPQRPLQLQQQQQQHRRASAVASAGRLPACGAGSKQKGRKQQQVEFELVEADIFEDVDAVTGGGSGGRAVPALGLVETERDRLIRLGILTPFDRLDGFERRIERGARLGAAHSAAPISSRQQQQAAAAVAATGGSRELEKHESIQRVGEAVRAAKAARPTAILMDHTELPRPDRLARRIDEGFWRQSASGKVVPVKKRRKRTLSPAKRSRVKRRHGGGSEEEEEEGEGEEDEASEVNPVSGSDSDAAAGAESGEDLGGEFDDADEVVFEERRASFLRRHSRQQQHSKARRRLRKAAAGGGRGSKREQQQQGGSVGARGDGLEYEETSLCGGRSSRVEVSADESKEQAEEEEEEEGDVVFEGGFRLPADLYARLFDYQRTAVKWMWELHTQRAGGIIGDEMGLGKTIQVIAFLAGLHHSGLFRPSLIVCPATMLRQWLRELRSWWPLFRVALLHDSARSGAAGGARPSRHRLICDIGESDSGILLTTYETMRLQSGKLLGVEWGYVVLDEGHKIRNPDAEVTLVAKQMQTVHRFIMSGSPIQNRLTELWSLFDFVFPGKLGTLPVFTAQFALPIQIGGYANASPLQVSTAYRCAVILRDLIAPYLLRRRKADVRTQLPQKTEQVLFCTLSREQRDLYRGYLASKELREIFAGSRTALAGIDILRKVCNHPDLLERAKWEAAQDYGNPKRSGKLQVLAKVLRHWHDRGHKALVFTQTQQILDIIEKHAEAQGFTYHRMDGGTSVAQRARLIDDFNTNPDIFCFLLTTRVGGLGVNLTGADRVVLYDPDWNPSTDVQARERAWRIGQTREVVIYRLITSGTIEEKVYHRQVYKHFLMDKVLRDPHQRRFFKAKDLTDLFTLGDEYADGTETASLFASLGTEVLPDEEAVVVEEQEQEQEQHASDRGDDSSDGGEQQQGRQTMPSANDRQGGQGGQASGDSHAPAGAWPQTLPLQEVGEAAGGGGGQKSDAKILRELFEGSGVRGAIDHSKVEGANDPGRRAADQEAARIARRAAVTLRQSRLQCQLAPVNEPTWTGRSGAAGVPGSSGGGQLRFGRAANLRLHAEAAQQEAAAAAAVSTAAAGFATCRFGGAGCGTAGVQAGTAMGAAPRSSQILERLRERQAAVASAAAAYTAADPAVEQARLLAAEITSFVEARGGAAASDELVSHFRASVNASQLPVFRGVLKQVAQLQRRPGNAGGGKVWVLKPDFAGGGGAEG